jgi:hypothetical protein
MRYAVSFQLQNRTKDFSRLSLPALSDISHGIVVEMKHVHLYHTPAGKALDKLLRATDSYLDWVSELGPDLIYDTGLNCHLGDHEIIFPRRVKDIDGDRIFVASFYHPVGIVAATVKHTFTLIREADLNTGRLLSSDKITSGVRATAKLGPKTLLTHLALVVC